MKVQVEIATGRPHQIRIHMASIGHPLVGDPLYAPGGLPALSSSAVPGTVIEWNWDNVPVLLFYPEYRLAHPEKCFFLLSKKPFSWSKYPKRCLILFCKQKHCDVLVSSPQNIFIFIMKIQCVSKHAMKTLLNSEVSLTGYCSARNGLFCRIPCD